MKKGLRVKAPEITWLSWFRRAAGRVTCLKPAPALADAPVCLPAV